MRNYQKIILFLVLLFVASGCSAPAPKDEQSKIDPSLENVTDVKFASDVKNIAFEWNPLRDTKVVGLKIYRGEDEESYQNVGRVETRYSTHYLDSDLKPNTVYFYKFATYTKEGMESNPSATIEVKTRDVLGPITFIESINNLPEQAKIIFRPHGDFRVNGYIVQRRTATDPNWEELDTIKGRLNAEYIDKELDHGKVYEYRLVGTTYEGYNTHPSKVVSVKTRVLPPIVRGLNATTTTPKKIVIKWERVSNDVNINYNVYRSESLDGGYDLVKSNWTENTIIDNVKEDGVVFFYKVTSVDEYGLESPKQKIGTKGNSLEKPLPPVIVASDIEEGVAVIKWEKRDSRNDTFIVKKSHKSGMFKDNVTKTQPTTDLEYKDSSIVAGDTYSYSIIAVDEYGVESEESEPVSLEYIKAKK